MTPRILPPLLLAASVAALGALVAASPASAETGCARAAHAYATKEISLVDPLKKLQACIKDRLGKKAGADDAKADEKAKKTPVNWSNCQATAARYARDDKSVSDEQLAELHTCVTETIKDFHK